MTRRAQLSDELLAYFATGDNIAALIGCQYAPEVLEALWRQHGADIVDEWIADAPGWRGWAWWRWTASEPRRVIEGVEHVVNYPWIWREGYGGPGVPGLRRLPDRAAWPLVESMAAYLTRLALLEPGERVPRPALEPERIAPFLEYDEQRGSVLLVSDDERSTRSTR
jgi:hypothetical protein